MARFSVGVENAAPVTDAGAARFESVNVQTTFTAESCGFTGIAFLAG